jgi:hypothetical protein
MLGKQASANIGLSNVGQTSERQHRLVECWANKQKMAGQQMLARPSLTLLCSVAFPSPRDT